jgi:hypothetical protein
MGIFFWRTFQMSQEGRHKAPAFLAMATSMRRRVDIFFEKGHLFDGWVGRSGQREKIPVGQASLRIRGGGVNGHAVQ